MSSELKLVNQCEQDWQDRFNALAIERGKQSGREAGVFLATVVALFTIIAIMGALWIAMGSSGNAAWDQFVQQAARIGEVGGGLAGATLVSGFVIPRLFPDKCKYRSQEEEKYTAPTVEKCREELKKLLTPLGTFYPKQKRAALREKLPEWVKVGFISSELKSALLAILGKMDRYENIQKHLYQNNPEIETLRATKASKGLTLDTVSEQKITDYDNTIATYTEAKTALEKEIPQEWQAIQSMLPQHVAAPRGTAGNVDGGTELPNKD